MSAEDSLGAIDVEVRGAKEKTSTADFSERTRESTWTERQTRGRTETSRLVSFIDPRVSSAGGGKSTLFASIINMANTVLGTGLLALPRAFGQSGMALGYVLLIFCLVVNVVTNVFISDGCVVAGRPASFKAIADQALPYFSIVADLAVIVNCVGSGCSYIIVAVDGFDQVIGGGRQVWVIVAICIVLPLSLLKTMDALRHTSIVAVVILLFVMCVVIAYSTGAHDDSGMLDPCPAGADPDFCPKGEVVAVTSLVDVIRAFSALAMAYQCQISTPTIWNEMENPTRTRMVIVYVAALGLAGVMYGIVAGCGYATYGDNVDGNILNSYPDTELVSTARIGLSFVVMFSYPIQAFAVRVSAASLYTVLKSCGSQKPEKSAFPGQPKPYAPQTCAQKKLAAFELSPMYLIPTLCFIGFTMLIGFILTDLGLVVDVSGSLGAATIAFTAPGVMYFRIFPAMPKMRILAAAIVVFGIFVTISGVTLAFV